MPDTENDLPKNELPLGSGIDEEEIIDASGEIHDPFDPTLIRVERINPTIDLIKTRIQHGEINLSPDFQRKGGIWTLGAQSRLIESMLIRIPLPAFYVDASDEDSWIVVDGLQRLTTLKSYIVEESFALQDLEFLSNLRGSLFSDLPRNLQRRIEETEVIIFTIQAGTPEDVKFNIFKRINTGGMPLSAQEIRNALNGERVRSFLFKLVESNEFLSATNNSINDKRMADRECATRFLAFKLTDIESYSKTDFDAFLNKAMNNINNNSVISDGKLNELESDFHRAMDISRNIFGIHAFRKYYGEGYRLSPINKAIFESWSVNLSAISDENALKLIEKKETVLSRFAELMNNEDFSKSVSQGTGSPSSIRTRFSLVRKLIKGVL